LLTYQVLSVNFSADGTQLCSGSADCTCIVWDIGQRKVKHRIKHGEWVEYVVFAPGHDRGGQLAIAACGHDIDIRLWNVDDHHEEAELIAMLPAQLSYLMMLFFFLRSLIYGDLHTAHCTMRNV
jgi:WD40 repeat protein